MAREGRARAASLSDRKDAVAQRREPFRGSYPQPCYRKGSASRAHLQLRAAGLLAGSGASWISLLIIMKPRGSEEAEVAAEDGGAMNVRAIIVAAIAAFALTATALAADTTWKADPVHSSATFTAIHLGISLRRRDDSDQKRDPYGSERQQRAHVRGGLPRSKRPRHARADARRRSAIGPLSSTSSSSR